MVLGRQAVETAVDRYVSALRSKDLDAWLATFADEAKLVDPVPSEPHIGKEGLAAFWRSVTDLANAIDLEVGALHVCGDEAAMSFKMTLTSASGRATVAGIQTFNFDPEGKIVLSKSYWEPQDVVAGTVEPGGEAGSDDGGRDAPDGRADGSPARRSGIFRRLRD